jgi:hypothetical protein
VYKTKALTVMLQEYGRFAEIRTQSLHCIRVGHLPIVLRIVGVAVET